MAIVFFASDFAVCKQRKQKQGDAANKSTRKLIEWKNRHRARTQHLTGEKKSELSLREKMNARKNCN